MGRCQEMWDKDPGICLGLLLFEQHVPNHHPRSRPLKLGGSCWCLGRRLCFFDDSMEKSIDPFFFSLLFEFPISLATI